MGMIKMNEIEDVNNKLEAYTDRTLKGQYAHAIGGGKLHVEGYFKAGELREILNIFQSCGQYTSKPTLHKIVRSYERGEYTASEMIGRIMLLEDVSDEDL